MAHLRNRLVVNLLKKRLSFALVLAVQGVRQCGKSALVMNLLSTAIKDISYDTVDRDQTPAKLILSQKQIFQKAKPSLLWWLTHSLYCQGVPDRTQGS